LLFSIYGANYTPVAALKTPHIISKRPHPYENFEMSLEGGKWSTQVW